MDHMAEMILVLWIAGVVCQEHVETMFFPLDTEAEREHVFYQYVAFA